MAFDKFLQTAGSGQNLSDGSTTIIAATLGAANLSPSTALKTNAVGTITSSNLLISDTTGLQQALDAGTGNVSAASAFTTDEAILVADGTGARDIKETLLTIDSLLSSIKLSGTLYIHSLGGIGNIAVGLGGLSSVTTASQCTAVGFNSLRDLTTGTSDISIGYRAMQNANIASSNNIAIGKDAMGDAGAASTCIAIGEASLQLAEGSDSISIGHFSQPICTTANKNISLGNGSLSMILSGFGNVAIGFNSQEANSTGEQNISIGGTTLGGDAVMRNVAIGQQSMQNASNTTDDCTFVGFKSGVENTAFGSTGVGSFVMEKNISGTQNCSFGRKSLSACLTGSNNCCFGLSSGANLLGSDSTAVGALSLFLAGNSDGNTAIGSASLSGITGGGNFQNVALGQDSGVNLTGPNSSDNLFIAHPGDISGVESNRIYIGNTTDHFSCTIAGIYNRTPGVNDHRTTISSTGELKSEAKTCGSTGIIQGAICTINASDILIDITDGNATFYNPATQVSTGVSWTGLVGVGATYSGFQTFVSIDITGNPVFQSTKLTASENRSLCFCCILLHPNAVNIIEITNQTQFIGSPSNQFQDLLGVIAPLNISGNVMSAASTDLSIQKSAGIVWIYGSNFATDITNPNRKSLISQSTNVSDTFILSFQDFSSRQAQTVLTPGDFDDGNGEANPGSVPANSWQVFRVFIFASGIGNIVLQPGQTVFNTAELAIAAVNFEGFNTIPANSQDAVSIGFIACRGAASDASNTNDVMFFKSSMWDKSPIS